MGNCFIRESSAMLWAGEDWGWPAAAAATKAEESFSGRGETFKITDSSENKAAAAAGGIQFCHSPATTTEVKIRITKKQLEELLGKVDVQGMPVGKVLEQLMSVSDRFETNQRSWRPALQSIPEIN